MPLEAMSWYEAPVVQHIKSFSSIQKITYKLERLRSFVNAISPLSEETMKEFEAIFVRKTLKKSELFINSGVKAKKIGFLKSGVIRAYYRNNEGQEYNKHFFTAPCFFGGYSSLITGKQNQIIQQTLTECEILQVDFTQLTSLYNKHQDLERMARKLAEQFFVQKEQREVEIVLLNADERYLIFKKQFPELEQLIPQYHIASYLGITPTQLSRIRRELALK